LSNKSAMGYQITDDLVSLLEVLPPEIAEAIQKMDRNDDLIEIILDFGRVPTARYTDGEYMLLDREVTQDDIDLTVLQVGDFDADNRAGIPRTLHRIAGMRNRRGEVVGLTCRVGRAVFGTIDIIRDIIESGKNLLLLGKPGVGKTTLLREAARVLSDKRRVVVVDTSNEIGGDGDIPHPAVGRARRMQVAEPMLQHEVMIEAVENHNPEVIIIDEIGRELEAAAARTIAERGVQLIGTAHGITLENLLLNPTLADLVGGIESVTLSDEEARRRGTQKTVLERRAPPTFDVLIEIQDRDTLAVHHSVMDAVDALLRGRMLKPEIRTRQTDGEIVIEEAPEQKRWEPPAETPFGVDLAPREFEPREGGDGALHTLHIFPYGVARNRLIEAARRLKVPLEVVDDLDHADALLTLKNFYRTRTRHIVEAEQIGIPIYVMRSNTATQIQNFLIDIFKLEGSDNGGGDDPVGVALREAREGIAAVLNGAELVDLSPQAARIRRKQHELIRRAHLNSQSYGREPGRHVRVFRE
jgi:stage III sporulation protein SpoIIIAA